MNVTVVVPVLYREPRLLDTLRGLAALRGQLGVEILVMIDVPDPAREAEVRAENDPITAEAAATPIYRVGDRGFGSALRAGFARATGEAVIPVMGDVSENLDDIPRLVAALDEGWDVVGGSRYMRGGGIVGNTAKQRVSKAYSVLMRLAGGPPIHDVSNAFKAYRRSVVASVPTVADSFDISVELTVKAALAGFRVGEVPTVWTNRAEGQSHFDVRRELRNYGRWLALVARKRRVEPMVRPRRSAVREATDDVR